VARRTVVVGYRKPTLGRLVEIEAEFIECLALGMTTWKCGDGRGIPSGIGFGTNDRRKNDINGNR